MSDNSFIKCLLRHVITRRPHRVLLHRHWTALHPCVALRPLRSSGTPSLHHNICVPTGPTLGQLYSIAYQQKVPRPPKAWNKISCSEFLRFELGVAPDRGGVSRAPRCRGPPGLPGALTAPGAEQFWGLRPRPAKVSRGESRGVGSCTVSCSESCMVGWEGP